MDLTRFLGYKIIKYDTMLDIINFREIWEYFFKSDAAQVSSRAFGECLLYSALLACIYIFLIVIINLLLKKQKIELSILFGWYFTFGYFCLGWFQNLLIFCCVTYFLIIVPAKIIYLQNLKLAFKDTIKSFQIYYVISIVIAILLVMTLKHEEQMPDGWTDTFGFSYKAHKKPFPAYYSVEDFSSFIEKWSK